MSNENRRVMYVFPGQGSQYKGMGSDLYHHYPCAKRVYDQASDILGYDIATLSFEDPDSQLNLTRYTQPALLTHQIACLEVFDELAPGRYTPFAAGGHSLGEYTALVVAEALSFENALRLVNKRGELMGKYGEGGMLATALDLASARALADKYYCGIGSYNLPEQTVVGGTDKDMAALAEEAAALYPRRRSVPLKTEGAFHTYFMVTAARHFQPILEATEMRVPKIQVLSNYTGDFHESDSAAVKARLFFQLFNTVNWVGCLQTAVQSGINTFIEFGGGIGRSDTPDGMRPNLESIIKKTLRLADHDALYLPAINRQTIEKTAQLLANQEESIESQN